MVKSYLRYAQQASWGVVVSGGGQVAVDASGKLAVAPALEAVHVWSIKQRTLVRTLRAPDGGGHEVTALELGADGDTLAVGHADGTVRVWRLGDGSERVVLTGHKGAVTSLQLSAGCERLVSCSNDRSVVLWDVVAEAGICRLRGHHDAVTDATLLGGAGGALASVGKDGQLKLWDLHTQHCVQSVAAPSGELWSVAVDADGRRLLTGGKGAEVILWSLETRQVLAGAGGVVDAFEDRDAVARARSENGGGAAGGGGGAALHATMVGQVPLTGTVRVARLRFSGDGSVVAVMLADRSLRLFSAQTAEQLRRQARRKRAKRQRLADSAAAVVAKAEAAAGVVRDDDDGDGDGDEDGDGDGDAAEEVELGAADQFQPLSTVKGAHKLHSFAFLPAANNSGSSDVKLLVAERNNAIRAWSCERRRGGAAVETAALVGEGHRQEVRSVCLSDDDRTVLSTSDGEAKVWSLRSRQCVRTLACGYALCGAFVLGGRYAVVGTKGGELQGFSLATGEKVAEVKAHAGAIWSLCTLPQRDVLLSASADKSIATWLVGATAAAGGGGGDGEGELEIGQEATLELADDAMCARYSADGKYVAVGLLDSTVKVLYADSLKQYLGLFGHKLPVTSLSLSSDGALLATASADKSVKLWGMDFGDCRRSILAHSEAVMAVAFVRDTHYFFTAGKDKLLKYWDADTFEQILILRGHHAEVWGLAISRSGAFVVSGGRDRSLRYWARGDEQVFLEEEKEDELERLFDAGLEKQQAAEEAAAEEAAALGHEEGGVVGGGAARKSILSLKGTERLLEALKTLADDDERTAEHAAAAAAWDARSERDREGTNRPVLVPNLLLLNLDHGAYLLKALTSIRAADLEPALILLPLDAVHQLLQRMRPLLDTAPQIELLAKATIFVLRVHHRAVVANRAMVGLLHEIKAALGARLAHEHSVVGYNVAALGFVGREIEEQSQARLFEDAVIARAEGKGAKDAAGATAELRRKTVARQRLGKGGKR